jgi:hypothetical protein
MGLSWSEQQGCQWSNEHYRIEAGQLANPAIYIYHVCMQDGSGDNKRMIRKQVYIRADQDAALKAVAERDSLTEAELIREGIDLALAKRPPEEDWRVVIRSLSGMWRDRDDMQDFVRDLRRSSGNRLKRLGLDAESGKGLEPDDGPGIGPGTKTGTRRDAE